MEVGNVGWILPILSGLAGAGVGYGIGQATARPSIEYEYEEEHKITYAPVITEETTYAPQISKKHIITSYYAPVIVYGSPQAYVSTPFHLTSEQIPHVDVHQYAEATPTHVDVEKDERTKFEVGGMGGLIMLAGIGLVAYALMRGGKK